MVLSREYGSMEYDIGILELFLFLIPVYEPDYSPLPIIKAPPPPVLDIISISWHTRMRVLNADGISSRWKAFVANGKLEPTF